MVAGDHMAPISEPLNHLRDVDLSYNLRYARISFFRQVCSRHIEVLLVAATTSQLLQLLASVNDANAVQEMASRSVTSGPMHEKIRNRSILISCPSAKRIMRLPAVLDGIGHFHSTAVPVLQKNVCYSM